MLGRLISFAALLTLIATVAIGQTPDAGETATGPPAVAAAADGEGAPSPETPSVDESALRYFAREGDLERLEAEVRRLKTLYPTWEPPQDLFDPKAAERTSDVQPLWDLYSAGRYGEAQEAIIRRQAEDPSWAPPPDLLAKLNEAEARLRLMNAADLKQWNSVLAIATGVPGLLVCENIDILWRVAEAFAGTGQTDRARDVYVYVLQNCQNPEERLATMDKAAALLPTALVLDLFRYARPQPDGGDEFASVRLDLIRRQVGAANEDPSLVVAPEDLARLQAAARDSSGADDAILLGFYYYRHDDPTAAIDWFDFALKRGGTAKSAEGYVLAMRSVGRDVQAEPIAYEWRDASVDNMVAYITLMTALLTGDQAAQLDQGVVDRFAAVVGDQRSALGAQALGWYAYNVGQVDTGLAWFTESMRWEPSEVAAYGIGIVLIRLKDAAALQGFVAQWAPSYPRLPELLAASQTQSTVRATPKTERETAAGLARPSVVPGVTLVDGLPVLTGPVSAAPSGTVPAATLPMTVVPAVGTTYAAADVVPVTATDATAAPVSSGGGVSGGRGNAGCVAATDAGARTKRLAPAAAVRRGWCLMELDRPLEAAAAFDMAVTASPNSTTGRDAAYGKTLAYLRLGLTDEAAVSAAQAPQAETRRTELGAEILTQRALAAYDNGRWTETILALNERARIVPDTLDLMMLRGWAYFQLGDFTNARQLFEAVHRVRPNEATNSGIAALNEILTRRRN